MHYFSSSKSVITVIQRYALLNVRVIPKIITVILHQNNEPSFINEEPRTMQIKYITRLLGRPQPQMYPPVALNQYTWVNRTHKISYIYFKAHTNFEIDFTPKLASNM